jgi:1,4-alpha-glucan branching enzyme
VFAFCRRDPDDPAGFAVVVANLTPVPRHGYRLGVPLESAWQVAFNSDDAEFAGSAHEVSPSDATWFVPDSTTPWQGQQSSLLLTLPPLSVLVLVPRSES